MKKGHLIGLGIIAVAIAIILTSIGDASSYESFATALEMKKEGEDKAIHVVGKLKKDEEGQVVGDCGARRQNFIHLFIGR